MNKQYAREIQVGVMVVIGIVILVVGLMFFKRVNLRTNLVPYAVDIAAVEGLRQGDRVQARGIRVGQVTGFEFRPDNVRVFIEVEQWVTLRDDADVSLVMKGLVGEVLLEIEPGRGRPVEAGHVFSGRSSASMLALGDKVDASLDVYTALGEEVRLLVAELRAENRITGPLDAAERTLDAAHDLFADNRAELRDLLRNVNRLTLTLEGALGDGRLDTTVTALQQAATSLDSTLVELRAATAQGRSLLAGLERGEGAAGRFLTDPSLYDRADSTLQSLDRLLDQMRRNPKAMFRLSVF